MRWAGGESGVSRARAPDWVVSSIGPEVEEEGEGDGDGGGGGRRVMVEG